MQVFDSDLLKFEFEAFEWIGYGNKHGSVLWKFCWTLPLVVSRVCECFRYRPASEGDDASATSPKKTKGDNKSQKTVRRKMDELWNGELFLKMY